MSVFAQASLRKSPLCHLEAQGLMKVTDAGQSLASGRPKSIRSGAVAALFCCMTRLRTNGRAARPGFLLPKPTMHLRGHAVRGSLPVQTIRRRLLVSACGRTHCHPVSHPGRVRLGYHLIRRDLRVCPLPAHTVVDLVECCSQMRSRRQR